MFKNLHSEIFSSKFLNFMIVSGLQKVANILQRVPVYPAPGFPYC